METKKTKSYLVQDELVGNRLDKAVVILDNEISRMTARKVIRRRKYNSKSEKMKKPHIKLRLEIK